MYGVVITVPAPVEVYDLMHAQLLERAGEHIEGMGLVLHVGRPTSDGFEVFEVWESKDHCDRANELVASLEPELAADPSQPSTPESTESFHVHGLIVPRGGILF